MRQLRRACSAHLHFIVIVTALTLAMTFPTIRYVFDTEVFWLPTANHPDTWMKFWDAWYGKRIIAGQADYFFTDLLFYPRGLSLIYHNFSVPHMLVLGALQSFMPPSNAYNLTFLLIAAAVTGSAYLYLRYLFPDKWIALLGAIVMGMSPYVLGYPEHPELRFIATIPLALYFFHRGHKEGSNKLVMAAAVITGLSAYTSLYIVVCLGMALAMYSLYFAAARWKEARFWAVLALFAALAGAISAPRILPMAANSSALEEAMGQRGKQEIGSDLLEFFVNARNPIVKSLFQRSFMWERQALESRFASYISYTALILALCGFMTRTYRRRMLPWLVLALPFLVLRLGSALTIDGLAYPSIVLPKAFLDDLIPAVFAGFRQSSVFMMGALLPIAALACYGAMALCDALPKVRPPLIAAVLIGLVAIEYYQPPRPGILSQQELAFLDWLGEEPADSRLIHLPMDSWSQMRYLFYQTLNGYPHAAGISSRTSNQAYHYIRGNYLLSTWLEKRATACSWRNLHQVLGALRQLEADGFSHVLAHRQLSSDSSKWAASFDGISAAYEDEFVSIYRLDDLRAPCMRDYSAELASASPFAELFLMPSVIYERHGAAVSFHQSQAADEDFLSYVSGNTFDKKSVIHLSYLDQRGLLVQSSNEALTSLDSIAASHKALWLLNNPREVDLAQLPVFRDWFLVNYRFCRSIVDRHEASIALYLQPDIPCDALGAEGKFMAHYDTGIGLHRVSHYMDGDEIRFHLAWTHKSERDTAFSLQLFDERDEKARQLDNIVLPELVSTHSMDISDLGEGAFTAQLIVYEYETGRSISGIAEDSGQRFDRRLEIARIERG